MEEVKQANNWQRNATFFIIGQFLSMFGSMIVQYAITWHVTLMTQSGNILTLFTCASLLPMVIISPFSGVWADRYNKKLMIIYSDGAIALVTLFVAILYFLGFQSIWLLLIAVIARSLGQGIQQPAVGSLIPQMVPKDALTRFNGIQSATQSLTMFAAPMVSGALLTFLSLKYIFLIDIVTAIIGISIVFFCVKISHVMKQKEPETGANIYFKEMMVGFSYIKKTSWLKTMFIAFAAVSFLCSPISLLSPLQVTRQFGDDVWRLATLEITFALGMMTVSILTSVWKGIKNSQLRIMVMTWFLIGCSTIFLGIVTNFWIYLSIFFLSGVIIPFYNITAITLMQTNTSEELMGRVYSVVSMIGGLASPLGMLIFGPLSDKIAIKWVMMLTGLMMLLGSFAIQKYQKLPNHELEM
ncbi:MFS transporter [Lactococcus raffinolactis]|uniref:MFS transporter n=2 Tax=Pseudolactococcus raffinolactis TaxID=1366 RepID=UPI001107DF29|nr:MFS transporter [Lactococcus raffinolactis]TLQ15747.1 MFS transporter [Lactococcus raffinolactis]